MCEHIHQCKIVQLWQRLHWSGVSEVCEGEGGHLNRCDVLSLVFLSRLSLISSRSSDSGAIMTPLICDGADGERWVTGGALRGEDEVKKKKETTEAADWQYLRKFHSLVHEPISRTWHQSNRYEQFMHLAPQHETVHPCSLGIMLRATWYLFPNRLEDENHCCYVEEENPTSKLSRCHVIPLGGRERREQPVESQKTREQLVPPGDRGATLPPTLA